MVRKTTVNAQRLEALGARRLAELLIELSANNGVAKRRLGLELASTDSIDALAKEVRNRLTAIARSRSFIDWQGISALADDLDVQRGAIVEKVAKANPNKALDLLWMFMGVASSVLERCDDSNGSVIEVFHVACRDIGDVAQSAGPNPGALADQVFDALTRNDYGQFDELIHVLSPALGQAGLQRVKARMVDLSSHPVKKPAEKDRVKIGWSSSGPIYADEMAESSRVSTVRLALMNIADALGDVDGFIEQYEEETRKMPKVAAEIAQRLLSAGRVEEAWQAIEAAEPRQRSGRWKWLDFAWADTRIDVLEALGRRQDAQATRWSCFERSLSAAHLRGYLKRLPDFDAAEAERKALDHAQRSPNLLQVLAFFVPWPALDRAERLVLRARDRT